MTGKATTPGRGRKPIPTKVKERRGNPGKRKLNQDEPEFSPFNEHSPPPPQLNEDGQRMWAFLLKELLPQGVLFQTDLEVVANYCIAYQNRNSACKDIDKYGTFVENSNGGLSKNPAFTVLNEALKQMTTFGSLLGLDPSSRQRLTGKADEQNINPFAELLQ
ncbi:MULTISPECIES: phage terminase small subunit P27 family [unclassified Mannheimia]|uniref:phage terminase small subunit P27 family n=1 Tax=unclassified Mannheimia TaxID=2645054 RepID=UPI00359D4021